MGDVEPEIMIRDFYGNCSCKRLESSAFKLRKNIITSTSLHRFPASGKPIPRTFVDINGKTVTVDSCNFIVKNCQGAPFDSFSTRQLVDDEGLMLFCGQQKYYQVSIIDYEAILKEYSKIRESLSFSDEDTTNLIVGSDYSFCCVLYCTKVISNLSIDDLPENCYGSSFERFFGPSFANRAYTSARSKINVNSASLQMLMSVRGIKESKATKIVSERDKGGPFKNFSDFESRVKGVGKSYEKLFIFAD